MNPAETPQFVQDYFDCFERTYTDDTPAKDVRFVVLDSETTGLDPRRDKLISIGAVSVCAGQILLADSFEALLRIAYNSSAVTVHGITRDQAADGYEEPEAIRLFLEYLKDGVIVGHHIGHDIATFNVAYERHFGFKLRNRSLDTMDLTLHLERAGAFAGQAEIRSFSLDSLCEVFRITPHDRHTAGGDALITAQIFLKLLRLGAKFGRGTLAGLCEPFVPDER